MKKWLPPKLYRPQDICFLCALRYGADSTRPRPPFIIQSRSYRSTASTSRPAGAAAALRDDEDDGSWHHAPQPPRPEHHGRDIQGSVRRETRARNPPKWKCSCGHLNSEKRGRCTLCEKSKPANAQYVTEESRPQPEPAPSIPEPPPSRLPVQHVAPTHRDAQSTDSRVPRPNNRTERDSQTSTFGWGKTFQQSLQSKPRETQRNTSWATVQDPDEPVAFTLRKQAVNNKFGEHFASQKAQAELERQRAIEERKNAQAELERQRTIEERIAKQFSASNDARRQRAEQPQIEATRDFSASQTRRARAQERLSTEQFPAADIQGQRSIVRKIEPRNAEQREDQGYLHGRQHTATRDLSAAEIRGQRAPVRRIGEQRADQDYQPDGQATAMGDRSASKIRRPRAQEQRNAGPTYVPDTRGQRAEESRIGPTATRDLSASEGRGQRTIEQRIAERFPASNTQRQRTVEPRIDEQLQMRNVGAERPIERAQLPGGGSSALRDHEEAKSNIFRKTEVETRPAQLREEITTWSPLGRRGTDSPRGASMNTDRPTAEAAESQQPVEDQASVPVISEENEVDVSPRREPRSRSNRRAELFMDSVEEPASSPAETHFSRRGTYNQRQSRAKTPVVDLDQLEEELTGNKQKRRKARPEPIETSKPQLQLPQFVSVQNLAQTLGIRVNELLRKLEEEGFEGARHDHILDSETSAMFADIYGFDPVATEPSSVEDLVARPLPADVTTLPPRPPIVTIMGHVDHGKTTILDYLRKASVAASEHGGITQHIGAFSVIMPGSERQITFLDTPGHAAFLDMRRRGANVTDIVVLVVAADDSVKPQTVEAIKHALDAQVQIIVAINKVDKEDADVDRVKQDLIQHNIIVEDYQGDYQAIAVSGKTGQGMKELEEAILTLADISDFRAETDGPVEGWVLESKVTPSGRVATVLVRRGTLRPGDIVVAGTTWARVRSLRNDAGLMVDEALPGTPVQVDGWRGNDPGAGAEVLQAEDEDQAKDVVDIRLEKLEALRASIDMSAVNAARAEEAEARAKVREFEVEQGYNRRGRQPNELEGWVERTNTSGPKQVYFVIKADVAGSVEALVAAVSAIGNQEVAANVVHSGVGELTESDIKHLAGTGETGYAISFNQPIDISIRRLAEAAELPILDHNIIYKLTDDVKEKMSDELPPLVTQRVLGEAEVGQVFEVSVKKDKVKIAGCRITNGTISRSQKIRVLRKGETVYTGTLGSLKNVKKDVTEMRKGSECGMGFEGWEDFEIGDQIQSFEELQEKRKLY